MAKLDFDNAAIAIKQAFYEGGRQDAQEVVQYFMEYISRELDMEDDELYDMLDVINKICDRKITERDIDRIDELLGEIHQLVNSSRYR